jgi:hypothetical protein
MNNTHHPEKSFPVSERFAPQNFIGLARDISPANFDLCPAEQPA